MNRDRENPWQVIRRETVYENPWIRVDHHDVINPSGGEGIYGKVLFQNLAIGILPVDEEGNTWLVGQYRFTMDRYSWEIPEGGCPIGTPPLESAQRELQEETGLTARRWELFLPEFHISNSVTDEKGMSFLARDLIPGPAAPEETEQLELKKVPLAEAIRMARAGEIQDLLSVVTLLKAGLWQKEGKL